MDIKNSGGDGMHLNHAAGRDVFVSDVKVDGAHGHGFYAGPPVPPPAAAAASAPPVLPVATSSAAVPAIAQTQPATRIWNKKKIASCIGAVVLVLGLLASSAQILDSPTYQKWVKLFKK